MKKQFETPAVIKKTTRKFTKGNKKLGKYKTPRKTNIKMFEEFCEDEAKVEENIGYDFARDTRNKDKKDKDEKCPDCGKVKCTCPDGKCTCPDGKCTCPVNEKDDVKVKQDPEHSKKGKSDLVDKIMAWEGGDMTEKEEVEFFQELVRLIDAGLVHKK